MVISVVQVHTQSKQIRHLPRQPLYQPWCWCDSRILSEISISQLVSKLSVLFIVKEAAAALIIMVPYKNYVIIFEFTT